MNKGDVLKIAVIVVIVLFILQYATMGLDAFSNQQNQDTQVDQYEGVTVVNATIDYYERTLYVFELDYESMELLESKESIKEIIQEEGTYVLSLKKKEDVIPVYNELKEMGIDSYATAKVTLQPSVTMYDQDQNEITAYFYNRKIKVSGLEPIFLEGSNIEIMLQVAIVGDDAFQSGSIEVYSELKNVEANATVLGKNHFVEYIVPWDKKSEVDLETLYVEYGEENVFYEQNDEILFLEKLSVEDQISKKFDYVEYITSDFAVINSNFTDNEQITQDFGENIIFQNSTLLINGEDPNLEFEKMEYDVFDLEIGFEEDYVINEELLNQKVIYEGELELNQTIDIEVEIVSTGNNIISLEKVTIVS